MESSLENQPLSEVMDMLESIADKHDLLLSTNLIDFADDIWALAYAQGMKDEAMANAYREDEAQKDKLTIRQVVPVSMVYLLWESDRERKYISGVYVNKIDAERDMRLLKENDERDGRGGAYFYYIQEMDTI